MRKIKLLNLGLSVPFVAMTFVPFTSCNTKTEKCTVIFDSNGGSNVESITLDSNSKLKAPLDPLKDGFIFDGWYTDDLCECKYNFEKPVYSDFTLYAKWKFDGQVTQYEWEHAINQIIDCNSSRNFLLRAETTLEVAGTEITIDGAYWAEGTQMKYCSRDPNIRMCSHYELTYKNHNWSLIGSNGVLDVASDGVMPTDVSFLQTVLQPIDDIKYDFESAVFDLENKIYKIKKDDELYTIAFNSEKKIKSFECSWAKFEFVQYDNVHIIDDPSVVIESIVTPHYYDKKTLMTNPHGRAWSFGSEYIVTTISDIQEFRTATDKTIHFSCINNETQALVELNDQEVEVFCNGNRIDSSYIQINADKTQVDILPAANISVNDIIVIKEQTSQPIPKIYQKVWLS